MERSRDRWIFSGSATRAWGFSNHLSVEVKIFVIYTPEERLGIDLSVGNLQSKMFDTFRYIEAITTRQNAHKKTTSGALLDAA